MTWIVLTPDPSPSRPWVDSGLSLPVLTPILIGVQTVRVGDVHV